MPKQTKRCPYCTGKGVQRAQYRRHVYVYRCTDCNGTGQRCILCCLPSVDCECAESAFDGGYSELDRPKIT